MPIAIEKLKKQKTINIHRATSTQSNISIQTYYSKINFNVPHLNVDQ